MHVYHESFALPKGNGRKTRSGDECVKRGVAESHKNLDIWDPVHPESMSSEDRQLIILQMMNYLEKYKPDMSFNKYKVRVLTRGDKQAFAGKTEGPVARVESLMMLLAIAIHQDLAIFKIDIGSAFMHTPMADDVIHKWVKLDKKVVQILIEIQPDQWKQCVLPDGSVIVKIKKLSYGYVEAVHYWWKDLTNTFTTDGYAVCKKDKCVFINTAENKYHSAMQLLLIVCLYVQPNKVGYKNKSQC